MANNTDPIVVVGMALKFPGEAISADSFWQMLLDGRSAQSEVPADRFNIDGFYHPNNNRQDSVRFSRHQAPVITDNFFR